MLPLMKRWQLTDTPTTGPTTSLVIGGDFCPTGRFGESLQTGREIFHPSLVRLFKSHYTLLNLEAPLCGPQVPPDGPPGSGLRGAPAVAQYLARLGVDAVALANNHIRDFGDEGILQTLLNLRAAGVQATGAGETLAAAEVPLEVTIDGTRIGIWALAEKELNVADNDRAGSAWFSPERNLPVIARLKAQYDVVVIVVHAGHEFITVPSPRIRDAYRSFIDAGADAVVAHHPHVVQGAERYGDGFIAYSLGNLVFDTPYVARYDGTDTGYLARLNLNGGKLHSVDAIPYRMTADTTVAPLNAVEMLDFERNLDSLSGDLIDADRLDRAWTAAAAFRWETEYRRILTDFSRNFTSTDNPDYARRSRNLFTCPTHVEMLEKIFLMLEAGELTRTADDHASRATTTADRAR